jgi:riboflavin kinase / FMN adenylyltransferase
MDEFTDIKNATDLKGPKVITIGNFDGLHLGHRRLIDATVKKAKEINGLAGVLTFSPHPAKVLRPEKDLKQLYTLEETLPLLDSAGVDFVMIQNFDKAFARTTAEQFVHDYLWHHLKPQHVVVGYDFAFGADRAGSLATLKSAGQKLGFGVTSEEPLLFKDQPISSSRIRELLRDGVVEEVPHLLGREYSVTGVVRTGHARGRGIGFPTANVFTQKEIIPRVGVYATEFFLNDRKYPSVTNIGYSPTFKADGAQQLTIETHIFNFDQSIYDENVEVFFKKRIRNEIKFKSVDELKAQIQNDVVEAKKLFT